MQVKATSDEEVGATPACLTAHPPLHTTRHNTKR